jgi:uncharacterized protein (DUF58 family)
LLDALRGVRWPARRAVGAALPGAHRSRQRGTSGEFTEYRLYRQGDDPKQLDWKLLGRSDRAFVRLTDDRALIPTWFVVDGSLSMAFPDAQTAMPSATPNKWQLAKAMAVGLGTVASASSDPVGAIVTSASGMTRLAARTRRGTIGEIARTLDGVQCGGSQALAPLLTSTPPTARVVIISDMLGDLDALIRTAAQRTVAGGIVECVHVVAREEVSPPDGAFLARDPEQQDVQRLLAPNAIAAYRLRFTEFRADTARRWRAAGAGYTEARTDAPLPRLIRQIVSGQGRSDSPHAGLG